MRLITNSDPYNGGKEEVSLLNNLIKRLHEHLEPEDISAWIVAKGVQSQMTITMQTMSPRKKIRSFTVLPALETTVLKLRETSTGLQGQPWFGFSLVVQNGSKPPAISYNWTENPRVHDVDLLLDLAEFPRERVTLPAWYLA
jgi:hypothetical protein